jgi:hypothetical protein
MPGSARNLMALAAAGIPLSAGGDFRYPEPVDRNRPP